MSAKKCVFHNCNIFSSRISNKCPCFGCQKPSYKCADCTTYLTWLAKGFDAQIKKCIECRKCR